MNSGERIVQCAVSEQSHNSVGKLSVVLTFGLDAGDPDSPGMSGFVDASLPFMTAIIFQKPQQFSCPSYISRTFERGNS